MTETAKAEAPEFRLVARGVVLRRKPKTAPLQPKVYGDVARIGDRMIARIAPGGMDAGPPWGAVELPAAGSLPDDDPKQDLDLTIGAVMPTDWCAEIAGIRRERSDEYQELQAAAASAREFARFAAEWPEVARYLKIGPETMPNRLFLHCWTGKIWYPRRFHDQALYPEWLRACVARHQQGDFGVYGAYVAKDVSQADLFQLPLLPIAIQNQAAVRMPAVGMRIRSRYPLEPAALEAARNRQQPWNRDVDAYLDIVTAVGPQPVTMLSLTMVAAQETPS
jgi:hypothetical protein